jgi:hypothetical protein
MTLRWMMINRNTWRHGGRSAEKRDLLVIIRQLGRQNETRSSAGFDRFVMRQPDRSTPRFSSCFHGNQHHLF